MIFKQIFGKTVDAALKSAKQIYGDDFTVFQTIDGDEKQKSAISVIADKKTKRSNNEDKKEKKPVYFERSDGKPFQKQVNEELHSLRKIAESQIQKSEQKKSNHQTKPDVQQSLKTSFVPKRPKNRQDGKESLDIYTRKSVRKPSIPVPETSAESMPVKESIKPGRRKRGRSLLTRFDETKPVIKKKETAKTPFKEKQPQPDKSNEIKTIHDRFDKLETLIYNSFMSSKSEYADHPVFQQLVETNIPAEIVTEWFKNIESKGVHPYSDSDAFVLELSKFLRKALPSGATSPPSTFQLFFGFSGSGKTTSIMKLITMSDPEEQKKTAVISCLPPSHQQSRYYTILEPFCIENTIQHYRVPLDTDLRDIQQELTAYSKVYIDTPSLPAAKEETSDIFKMIQRFIEPFPDVEMHFTVNMKDYAQDISSLTDRTHSFNPDFILLSHLDEIEKWGPVIPLFERTGSRSRYISVGNSLNSSLKNFDAAWLTKNILENTK